METMAKDMVIKSPGFQTKYSPPTKKSGSTTDPPTPGKAVRFNQEYIDGKSQTGEMLPTSSSFFEEEDEEDFEDAVSEFFSSPKYATGLPLSDAAEGEQDRGHKRAMSLGSFAEGHPGALEELGTVEEPRLPAAGLISDNRMNVSSVCVCVCVCVCVRVCACVCACAEAM